MQQLQKPAASACGGLKLGCSLLRPCSSRRGPMPFRATTGYSAGDSPEQRKNAEVYSQLQATTQLAPKPAGITPPSVATLPTGDEGSSPAVSYAVPAGAAAAAVASGKGLVKPEVLAPAGGWPQLKAACENGADAVYFGLEDFSARARASNFTRDELPEVMSYLHERGLKGYVAFNVLVFDSELESVEEWGRVMACAGVDAVIVQDLGVIDLLRRVAPNLPVHGSTQMTVTSPEGADFVAGLGVDRVVVGRELSVREIAKVRTGTNIEVEAFVHGALCVSYSGQCFSSEAWGGRSANRGQCAQACRMPYGLIVDGDIKEMGDIKYLLSPQDLMAVEQVPELIAAGVSCFKIEGRLKGPEYVSLTTRVYRQAVDAAWEAIHAALDQQQRQQPAQGQQGQHQHQHQQQQQQEEEGATAAAASTAGGVSVAAPVSAAGGWGAAPAAAVAAAKDAVRLSDRQRWDLEQVFSRGQDQAYRGLTPGFLEGVVHQRLVRGRAPRHRGVFLGTVAAVTARGVSLSALQAPLKRGDGVVFDAGMPEEEEVGGAVYEVESAEGRPLQGAAAPGQAVQLKLGPEQGRLTGRVQVGDLVWKTHDPDVEQRLKRTYDGLAAADMRKVAVDVALSGVVGQPLTIVLRDELGFEGSACSQAVFQVAGKRPMTVEELQKALGQNLGHVTLDARHLDTTGLDLAAGLFLPASELKAVRRTAVDALLQQRLSHTRAQALAPHPVLPNLLAAVRERPLSSLGGLPSTPSATASSSSSSPSSSTPLSSTSTSTTSPFPTLSTTSPSSPSAASAGASAREQAADGLRVLCRTRAQVEAACQVPWLKEVLLDFLEVQGLKEAVASVKQAGKRVVVATPRVLKPDEERLVMFYLRLGADALLVRSLGMLHQMAALGGAGAPVPQLPGVRVPSLEGDFSLNAANALSADLLIRNGRLSRLTPTHDLNARQLADLARGMGDRAVLLEAVLHQHLPIFHTEHCVFCRFLSSGNSYKDCGHPCEKSNVHLRDEQGKDHLVLADMGCRNTVFNAAAQSGLWSVPELVKAGYRHLRIELVDEPAQFVGPILEGYRNTILGSTPPSELWSWLGTLPDANGRAHGVTPGSLESGRERGRSQLKLTATQAKQRRQQAAGAGGR